MGEGDLECRSLSGLGCRHTGVLELRLWFLSLPWLVLGWLVVWHLLYHGGNTVIEIPDLTFIRQVLSHRHGKLSFSRSSIHR